jgi:hypothetical protein
VPDFPAYLIAISGHGFRQHRLYRAETGADRRPPVYWFFEIRAVFRHDLDK